MSGLASHLLPALESFGAWSYWIVAAAALLESWWITGVVVPGTLVVDAGGTLVRLGALDYLDLVWFVALGAGLGGELGFWTGRRLGRAVGGRGALHSRAFRRAEDLFHRRGGAALLIGRFLGPVAGLMPLAAALSGMEPRRFRVWNWIGAVPYALVHVTLGAAIGEALVRLGPLAGRLALVVAVLALVLGLLWLVSAQLRRGLPLLRAGLGALRDAVAARPGVRRFAARHPGTARFVAGRLDPAHFSGLTLTVLGAVFLYVAGVWIDSAFDFVSAPQVAATDRRLAELIHAWWTPSALHAFGLVTQLGHWTVVSAALGGALAVLALLGRWPSLVQLLVALGGDLVTVRLLKGAFGRDRPTLSYFTETSGSFPSGHAAVSVAFWGTLFVILWREKVIGPTAALFGAVTAAALIGASRLYLIEHFLSDVVNGWIVGTLWLIVGLAVAEWMRDRARRGVRRQARRRGTGGPADAAGAAWAVRPAAAWAAGGIAALLALWLAWAADPPRAEALAAAPPPAVDPVAALGTEALPLRAETLTGEDAAPVALVVAAPDVEAVVAPLRLAGWTAADRISLEALLHLALADWWDRPAADTPLLPLFWQGRPQAASFRSPDGMEELRVWRADARETGGMRLFALALSPGTDERTGEWAAWSLAAARDRVAALYVPRGRVEAAAPQTGRSAEGQDWIWDGVVVVAGAPS